MKTFFLFQLLLILFITDNQLFSQDCVVLDTNISGSYAGKCKKGLAQGKGVSQGKDKYEGNFKKGMKHKEGIYTWSNGDEFIGTFYEDRMHGLGTLIRSDTIVTQGYWKNNKYVGKNIEDFNGYKILSTANLLRKPVFRKMGEGNEIIIFIDDTHNSAQGLSLLNYTSGQIINENGHKIRMTNVSFPFGAILKYRVLNSANSFMMDIEMSFIITEKGIWNITITHN